MSARVVLLTNPGHEGRALAHCMVKAGCAPVLIVREHQVERYPYSLPSRIARKLLGDAIVDRAAQWRLPAEVRELLAWEREAQKASAAWLEAAGSALVPARGWPEGIDVLDTEDVNAPDVIERARDAAPDLFAVYGTGLLRPPLLAIPPRGTLNAHSSLLPHYRGARSEFWQCYNDDPSAVGISIHLVEPTVDSGPILFQYATRTIWPSDPYRLRAANVLATLEHFPRVIIQYLQGRTTPVPQGNSTARPYRKRDVTIEARLALKKRIVG